MGGTEKKEIYVTTSLLPALVSQSEQQTVSLLTTGRAGLHERIISRKNSRVGKREYVRYERANNFRVL